MKKTTGLLILLGLLCSACLGSKNLDATGWILVSLDGQPALTDVKVTMTFTDGKVGGKDGCNTYSGSYKESGSKLTFGKDFMSTMMACSEPIMTQSSSFISALTQTTTSQVDGDRMTLFDKTGKELAVFAKQDNEFSGSTWKVTAINNGKDALVSIMNGTEITMLFDAGGKLSGSAGCNHYSAGYETAGLSLKIGQAASTKMMCTQPDGLMQQEASFLNILGKVDSFQLDGDTLDLLDQDGTILLSLQK